MAIFAGLLVAAVSAVQAKPPVTTSWYVYVTDDETGQTLYDWAYGMGYKAGRKDLSLPGAQYSLIVLDFGQPSKRGAVYGTWSFSKKYGRFVSTTVIKNAVKMFARGYASGSDTESFVTIAVGTNNYGPHATYAHGEAWAQMVMDIESWARATPGIKSAVSVNGASDIEVDYSSPQVARSWVNGFMSSNYRNGYSISLYNYGDAAGCPQRGTTRIPGNCNNGWTQQDVLDVSPIALPQIYATSGANARQWQQIALYHILRYGSDPEIWGTLSQRRACAQRGGCSGTDNTPSQAWSQLWDSLNSNKKTMWMRDNMTFSTDIKWRK